MCVCVCVCVAYVVTCVCVLFPWWQIMWELSSNNHLIQTILIKHALLERYCWVLWLDLFPLLCNTQVICLPLSLSVPVRTHLLSVIWSWWISIHGALTNSTYGMLVAQNADCKKEKKKVKHSVFLPDFWYGYECLRRTCQLLVVLYHEHVFHVFIGCFYLLFIDLKWKILSWKLENKS